MYRINEAFLSVQGEGIGIGQPSLFLRFSGCNLSCDFCDTPHGEVRHSFEKPEDLFLLLEGMVPSSSFRGLRLIFTGGEPLLQVDEALIDMALRSGFQLCLETNGALDSAGSSPLGQNLLEYLATYFETVTVSPKSASVDYGILRVANCLKVVWPTPISDAVLETMYLNLGALSAGPKMRVFQPMTIDGGFGEGTQVNCQKSVHQAIQMLSKYGQEWRVIPQTHVAMGLR